MPGASVLVTNEATRIITKAKTDHSGFYVAADLPVGSYDVTVAVPGFKKTEKTGFDLVDERHITADFRLEIGAITDSAVITTTPAGETVNTVQASSVIRSIPKRWKILPSTATITCTWCRRIEEITIPGGFI